MPLGIWLILILLTARFVLLLFGFITLMFSWLFRIKIRNAFIDNMLSSILLRPKNFNLDEGIGETAFKFRSDLQEISFLLTTDIPRFVTAAVIAVITLVIMISINVVFTIATVILIILNIVILKFMLSKIGQWREKQLNAASFSSGHITASLKAVQEIKTNHKQKCFVNEYFRRCLRRTNAKNRTCKGIDGQPELLILDDCFTAIDNKIATAIRKNIASIENLTVIEIVNKPVELDKAKIIRF